MAKKQETEWGAVLIGIIWGTVIAFAFTYMSILLFGAMFLGRGSCLPSLCR